MPYTDISKLSTCTTCHFTQDFSNYWTANLYFRARNGSYKRVPQIANEFQAGDNAGITIYYTSPGPKLTTAFRPVGLTPAHLGNYKLTHQRASACSRETPSKEPPPTSEKTHSNAIVATPNLTGAAVRIHLAWTRCGTPTTSPNSPARAVSAPTSFSRFAGTERISIVRIIGIMLRTRLVARRVLRL